MEINYILWLHDNPMYVSSVYGSRVDFYDVRSAVCLYEDDKGNKLYGFEEYPKRIDRKEFGNFKVIK